MKPFLSAMSFLYFFTTPAMAQSLLGEANGSVAEDLVALYSRPFCLPRRGFANKEDNKNSPQRFSFFDYHIIKNSSLFKTKELKENFPPLPSVSEKEAYLEAERLIVLLKEQVHSFRTYSPEKQKQWIDLAQTEIDKAGVDLNRAQILIVVDRNPRVQALCFLLAFPKGKGEWTALGGNRVSTGQAGRRLYYITPTGVFINHIEHLGYRALGTKNRYGIRGNGIKGMRVWDFGWQWAEKGWLPDRKKGQIRLEMHATDPTYLESRLGHTASEGCVRISADMNRFIDRYGLIDALYNQAAQKDIRFRAVLLKDREPSSIAGDALVVIDSSQESKKQQS